VEHFGRPGCGADLTAALRTALALVAADDKHLYKAYLMTEQLREAFAVKGEAGRALLAGLISWWRRCRIPEFTALAKTLKNYQGLIWNTLDHQISNGRAEGVNIRSPA
jgi:transposase